MKLEIAEKFAVRKPRIAATVKMSSRLRDLYVPLTQSSGWIKCRAMLARSRLLIVDDSQPFRRFVCTELQRHDHFEVIGEVSDGLKAIEVVEALQPDLILLDMGLPGLNGLGVAQQIQRVSPRSKILFVSQESSTDIVQEALRLGARGYVHKLRALSDLLLAIERVSKGETFISPSLALNNDADVHRPRRHDILFCSDDAAIVTSLVRFIASALDAGNPAIVWATEAHREGILRKLRADGIDIDVALQRGMYMSVDISEPPDRSRVLETIRRLTGVAGQMGNRRPRVAACGERAGRLWSDGKTDEAIHLERLCNELAESEGVDILCLYPLPDGQVDATVLENICAQHTHVFSLP